MSIEAYKAAWAADLKPADKIVLLAIAEFASKHNGYTCTASNDTIAGMVGVSSRAVRSTLRRLETAGLVKTEINRGRHNTNVYDISGLVGGNIDYKKPEVDFLFNKEKPEVEGTKPEVERHKTGSELPPNRINPINHNNIYIKEPPQHIAGFAETWEFQDEETQLLKTAILAMFPRLNGSTRESVEYAKTLGVSADAIKERGRQLHKALCRVANTPGQKKQCEAVIDAIMLDVDPNILLTNVPKWTAGQWNGKLQYPSVILSNYEKIKTWTDQPKPAARKRHEDLPAVVGEF